MTSLLRRVRTTLTIHARRPVWALLDGEYASVFHGRSLEFDDLRPYVPGDEVKDVDWKATARLGSLMTRRYIAQRKHTILLVVDTGRSMAAIAASGEPKRELAVLAAGTIASIAQRHGDLVGLVTGDAAGTETVRPASSEAHLERLLQRIHDRSALDAAPGDLSAQLEHVLRVVPGRPIVVVITDDRPIDDAERAALRRLTVRHDVLWITIGDADLMASAHVGSGMRDVESAAALPAYLRRDRALAREFDEHVRASAELAEDTLRALGVATVRIASSARVVTSLIRLLEAHRHARR